MSYVNRPQAVVRFSASMVLAGTALFLTACATVPEPPTAALAEARVAINTAEKDNAAQYAGPALIEARQQLAQANSAVGSERMIEAGRHAHQARIAAELASARTEAAKAAEVNRELSKGAEVLFEEIMRAGDQQ